MNPTTRFLICTHQVGNDRIAPRVPRFRLVGWAISTEFQQAGASQFCPDFLISGRNDLNWYCRGVLFRCRRLPRRHFPSAEHFEVLHPLGSIG